MRPSTRARFAALVCCACSVSMQADKPASPTFGRWKGCTPGDYIIEYKTNRSSPSGEYHRTVLINVDKHGEGGFTWETAAGTNGPWTFKTSYSSRSVDEFPDDDPNLYVERTNCPDVVIACGGQSLSCRVVHTTVSEQGSTKDIVQWIDRATGLDIRHVIHIKYSDPRASPVRNEMQTVGIVTVQVAATRLVCFDQVTTQSFTMGFEMSRQVVSPLVPGHAVSQLVEWGHNPALLTSYKSEAATKGQVSIEDDEERLAKEDTDRRRESANVQSRNIAELSSADPEQRVWALRNLADFTLSPSDRGEVSRAIVKALDDPSAEVRRCAAWSAGQCGVTGLTPRIVALLADDPDGAQQYLPALGLQHDPAALAVIGQYAAHSNWYMRELAVRAMGSFTFGDVAGQLARAVRDEHYEVRLAAVEALETIGDRHGSAILSAALCDTDKLVVSAAIMALRKTGDDAAVPPLLSLLATTNDTLRADVCACLGSLKLTNTQTACTALRKMVDDKSPFCRINAMVALGALRDEQTVTNMIAVVQKVATATGADALPTNMMALVLNGTLGAIGGLCQAKETRGAQAIVTLLDTPRWHEIANNALADMGDVAAEPLLQHARSHAASGWMFERETRMLQWSCTINSLPLLRAYLTNCPPYHKAAVRNIILSIEGRSQDEADREKNK